MLFDLFESRTGLLQVYKRTHQPNTKYIVCSNNLVECNLKTIEANLGRFASQRKH